MDFNTIWQALIRDIKERFLTFETLKGIYLVPLGLIIIYASTPPAEILPAFVQDPLAFPQYHFQAALSLVGWYVFSEGLRKIQVNRVKQEVKKTVQVLERLNPDDTNSPAA
jgi:hypothetical protein